MTQTQQRPRQRSFGERRPEAQSGQDGWLPSRPVHYSTSAAGPGAARDGRGR
jgi:hypothetical protein